MKLIRHGEPGIEKPRVILDGLNYNCSDLGEDYNELFFATGGLLRLQRFVDLKRTRLERLSEGTRLGPPVARPSKIVCVGLNYAKHAAETGNPIPVEPIIFMKASHQALR
jgi:2-keto-4-pentenoate hydratase/2-oxohepta-3-ene-1,7-dioic acid hydratase in catechol pathway